MRVKASMGVLKFVQGDLIFFILSRGALTPPEKQRLN